MLNLKEVATAWIVNSGLPANILQIFCKYFANILQIFCLHGPRYRIVERFALLVLESKVLII